MHPALLAVVDGGGSWLFGVGAVLTAVFTGLVAFLQLVHRVRLESLSATEAGWQAIVHRLEAEMRALQERHDGLASEHDACREKTARHDAQMTVLCDYLARQQRALTAAGIATEPIPDFSIEE